MSTFYLAITGVRRIKRTALVCELNRMAHTYSIIILFPQSAADGVTAPHSRVVCTCALHQAGGHTISRQTSHHLCRDAIPVECLQSPMHAHIELSLQRPQQPVRRDRAAAVSHAAYLARLGHAAALASSAILQIEPTMRFLAQQSQHEEAKEALRRQGSLDLVDTSRSSNKATQPRLPAHP
jgi:hypothetical protein